MNEDIFSFSYNLKNAVLFVGIAAAIFLPLPLTYRDLWSWLVWGGMVLFAGLLSLPSLTEAWGYSRRKKE